MAYFSAKCKKWTTFSVASVLILLGVLLLVWWNTLYQSILRNELSVTNKNTVGYSMWKETPIPMYIQFYLFNWTNPEEVIESKWKEKPILEEHGPYTFSEHHIREDVIFNDNNYTLTYKTKRIWKFLPEKSNGSLADEITVLNPILLTVAYIVRNKHILVRRGVNFFFKEKQEHLYITKTAGEFLFEGYNDPVLDLAHKLNISGFNIPFDKFGWFYQRNESAEYDGVFNMFTGADDIEKLGRIIEWNYNSTVPFYQDQCNDVEGTSGELWYPPKESKTLSVFASDVCGSIKLDYEDEYNHNGIIGKKYLGKASVFSNVTEDGKQSCYLTPDVDLASGSRNVSLCKFDAPAFVSYPHFYLADESYREPIEGMKPDKNKHQFYMALEPETGLPLMVHASFQLSLQLLPIPGIDVLANVPEMFMPMLWFTQTAELSKELSDEAKILLVLPTVGHYTGYGVIVMGGFIFTLGLYFTFRKSWKDGDEEQLINQESF